MGNETIDVRYAPIKGFKSSGGGNGGDAPKQYYHKYLVYTQYDDNGDIISQRAARGGTTLYDGQSANGKSSVGIGNINTDEGPFDSSFKDFPNDQDPGYIPHPPPEILASGDDLSSEWQTIKDTLQDIEDAEIPYSALSANSNSAIDTAVDEAGLPQPQLDGRDDYWSPASGKLISIPLTSPPAAPIVSPKGDQVEPAENGMNASLSEGSPLVLDINGDGINLTDLDGSNAVYWDLDVDGFAEASGWVASDDGLLAIDTNADGAITDSSELFGDQTGYSNGFLALAAYDDNNDGHITADDSVWNDLLVWQDTDGNAISDSMELHTLDSLGISDIDLCYTNVSQTIAGNNIYQESSFTINGQTRDIADVYFQYDDVNTVYNDDYEFSRTAEFLPSLRGYGEIPDMHIALSLDGDIDDTSSILHLLTDFNQLALDELFTDDNSAMDDVIDIMYRWAGVDDVDPASRGEYFDAQKLEFLEKYTATDFIQRGYDPNPRWEAAEHLDEAFFGLHQDISTKLIAQSAGAELFTGDFRYDFVNDEVTGITGLDLTTLSTLETNAASVSDLESYWGNIVRVIEHTVGTANLSTSDETALDTAINNTDVSLDLQDILDFIQYQSNTPTTVSGDSSDNTLNGGSGDDDIYGDDGNDTVYGGTGNDTLYGGYGDDTLDGEIGGDYVFGNFGNDRYVYNAGHNDDVYQEQGSDTGDHILFGAGISLGDLSFSRVGNSDLLIEIDNGTHTGTIVVENQFNYSPGGGHIEYIQFADTSTYTLDDKNYIQTGTHIDDYLVGTAAGGEDADTMYGGDGNDTIYGGAPNQNDYETNTLYGEAGADSLYGDRGDDIVDGGTGNDYLYGDGGADSLTGGTGNDIIHGGSGNDTYYYNVGDGDDTYQEDASDTGDKIVFGAGISFNDLTFSRFGTQNILMEIDGGGSIMMQRQTNTGEYIETLEFADTSTVAMSTVDVTTYGTSGDDNLSGVTPTDGASGVDTIYGGDGNDTIYAKGNNSYEYLANTLYGEGGNDILYGDRGDDVIEGGIGDDYIAARAGNDILTGGLGDDTIIDTGGDDIYYYNLGDGNDTYREDGDGNDKIVFGAGITYEDLTITKDAYYNVMIEITGGGSIYLENQTNHADILETMEFADSSTVNFNDIDMITYGTAAGETIIGTRPGYGGTGVDKIYGGDGNDTIYVKGTNSYEYLENTAYGEGGDDIIYGNRGNDTLYGGDGDDELQGAQGNDILSGGAGNDYLRDSQGSGDDTYLYQSGLDSIYNYKGDDTLVIDNSYTVNDITFDSSTLNHKLIFDAGVDEVELIYAGYNGHYEIDNIKFSDGFESNLFGNAENWIWGTDTYNFTTGTTGDDGIVGKGGDDDLSGNAGADDIHGGSGADMIDGDTGDDFLHGGTGDDEIYGGSGNDIMFGGDDADTFIFESGTTASYIDTISDFSVGDGDMLDIADLLTGYDPMTDLISDFIQITDDGTDSALSVDADGGADNFVQIATLLNVTGLTDEASLESAGTLITV